MYCRRRDCQPNGLPELGKSAFYPHRQDERDRPIYPAPASKASGLPRMGALGATWSFSLVHMETGHIHDIPSVIRMSGQVVALSYLQVLLVDKRFEETKLMAKESCYTTMLSDNHAFPVLNVWQFDGQYSTVTEETIVFEKSRKW